MKNLPFIILLFLCAPFVKAQEIEEPIPETCEQKEILGTVSGGLVFGGALGEFANVYDETSTGYGFSILLSKERIPFLHVGLGYTQSNLKVTKLPGEMFEYDKVRLKTRMHEFYGEARLSPLKKNFRPYIFGLAGIRAINDVVRVSDYDEKVLLFKNKNMPFFSGWGAGIIIGQPGKLNYEVKFQKTDGGRVNLVDHDTFVPTEGDEFLYTTSETRSDFFTVHVGISLTF